MESMVIDIFSLHKRRYGSRRISQTLRKAGFTISREKVGKILRKYGLKSIQPRSFVPKTTDSRHTYKISPNLLLGEKPPDGPNQVWVGDITYIPMSEGRWLYLAVWMDLFSRLIKGWELAEHMQEELIIKAFKKASPGRKKMKGLITHSDRGGQYAGIIFRKLLADKDILQSMSRADNPYDNAFMESCFSRFKAELLQNGIFDSFEDAQTEIFEYIEMYYNRVRIHSSLGYETPLDFEQKYEGKKH
jgi:transposase InsO family protein